jgi:CRISPR system Cascade subunit CasD
MANALGWRHRDADGITDLQDQLWYAVREDRVPDRLWDYQTADLGALSGWGRWGPTEPGGAFSDGTHVLRKEYLADACFLVALGLREDPTPGGVTVRLLERAVLQPARPLALGRKSCPPATRILDAVVDAASPWQALQLIPAPHDADGEEVRLRVWMDQQDLPVGAAGEAREIWDRRNYRTSRFDRSRRIVEVREVFQREV